MTDPRFIAIWFYLQEDQRRKRCWKLASRLAVAGLQADHSGLFRSHDKSKVPTNPKIWGAIWVEGWSDEVASLKFYGYWLSSGLFPISSLIYPRSSLGLTQMRWLSIDDEVERIRMCNYRRIDHQNHSESEGFVHTEDYHECYWGVGKEWFQDGQCTKLIGELQPRTY